jgi:HEAT repeat protein
MKASPALLAAITFVLISGCASVTEQDLADLSSPNAIIKEKALLTISKEPSFPLNMMDFLVSRGNEEKAVNVLLGLLAGGKESKDVELGIIRALGQLGQRTEVPWGVVIERLQDKDRRVRDEAIQVLGKTRNNKAATALLGLLEEEPRDYSIIWALGEIGTSKAIPTLNRLMTDEDPYARYNAYKALEKIGSGQAEDHVPNMTENSSHNASLLDAMRIGFDRYKDAMIFLFQKIAGLKRI